MYRVHGMAENDKLLRDKDVAAFLDLHVETVRRYRREGTGPRFVTLGEGTIRYRREDVDEYLNSRTRKGGW